jgi:uncharacterized protein (DUF1778 family)
MLAQRCADGHSWQPRVTRVAMSTAGDGHAFAASCKRPYTDPYASTEGTLMSPATMHRTSPARATERFEFRLQPEAKQAIAAAASALGMDSSDFAREVLMERASEVLAEHAVKTVVPASFFDELVAALDEPVQANDALRRAAAAARANIDADHLHP